VFELHRGHGKISQYLQAVALDRDLMPFDGQVCSGLRSRCAGYNGLVRVKTHKPELEAAATGPVVIIIVADTTVPNAKNLKAFLMSSPVHVAGP
jgi:ribosomal protein L35AE/L33A